MSIVIDVAQVVDALERVTVPDCGRTSSQ